MTTFEKMINNKRYAEPGNATPIRKIGGLTIDFSHQKFSQEFLEAFIEQTEKQKIIERFAEIYSGKEVNKTENRAVDHFEYRKKETLRKAWTTEAQKRMIDLSERINKQQYEAIIFFWHRRR